MDVEITTQAIQDLFSQGYMSFVVCAEAKHFWEWQDSSSFLILQCCLSQQPVAETAILSIDFFSDVKCGAPRDWFFMQCLRMKDAERLSLLRTHGFQLLALMSM